MNSVIFLNSFIAMWLLSFVSQPKGDLQIEITGLRNSKGTVLVALYDNAEYFPDESSRTAAHGSATIVNGKAMVHFTNLPSGKYAAAIFHDENNNGKMDFNMLGIAKEGYGFSNNAKAKFGPPSFAKAAFLLSANKTNLGIKATYFF